jgi:outer membrane protein assembly factor BamD
MKKNLLRFIAIALMLQLSACGIFGKKKSEDEKTSASQLYKEAMDELDSGRYESAVQHFERLESQYPFGVYGQQAQMEIAYAYYRQDDKEQGLAAADRFIKLHPNHPNVDYVYYLRGLINFNDRVGTFDFVSRQDPSERDPKAARDSFDAFKLLVERFPNSKYTPDALGRMKYLVTSLARYEVHVARYYYRRGAYVAAAERAQSAVRDYREAPAIEEALYIMVKSYDALNLPVLRDDAQRVLKQTYPNSEFLSGSRAKEKSWWKFW